MNGIHFVQLVDADAPKVGRVTIAVLPYMFPTIKEVLQTYGIRFENFLTQVHSDWVNHKAFVVHPTTHECFYINDTESLRLQGFSLLTKASEVGKTASNLETHINTAK